MSSYLRVARERWRAKEMVLTRWLKKAREVAVFREPICELLVDGAPWTFSNNSVDRERWGIYSHLVQEGQEVAPMGELFEYSDMGFVPRDSLGPDRVRRHPYRRRNHYPRVFLSYRRDDSEAYAWRAHEAFGAALGDPHDVFMDQFSIGAEPWQWAIQQAAAQCQLMVVFIGPKWLGDKNEAGQRKIDSRFDLLRREVTAALDRQIPIVPVLLHDTRVPEATSLPDEMRGIEEIQMMPLSARRWREDMTDIVAEIRRGLQ